MSKLSKRPQNLDFGLRAGILSTERKSSRIDEYYRNPKLCKQCDEIIPYEKRYNQFCNHSCSAKYNNKYFPRNNPGPAKTVFPFCKISFEICETCNKPFRKKAGNSRYCSPICIKYSSAKAYRNACKFKLNKKDHPELFDGKLIEQHGWYMPSNMPNTNLTGVCWDHLYRIEEAYKNNIDPAIVAHPANAELIPWRVNYYRKQSMISLEELYERIKQWGSGNRDLKYFYVE